MKSSDIRERFLKFFENNAHQRVASSSLIPADDPTLMFTNAGMVQFKDVFLGFDKRDYDKAATSQRCLRAGGKHNDLENVGYTYRHHTFFEMLGNFSFGDYFKERAIPLAWELLTSPIENGGYGLEKEHLWVTIFGGGKLFGEDSDAVPADDEAYEHWLKTLMAAGFNEEEAKKRITKIPTADNFWMMGDTGPCGPCSEIFYNRNKDATEFEGEDPDKDDICVEIWNLVFMQFNRDNQGTLNLLPKPCVDTGMGLERLAAVLQDVESNYQTDLFISLINAAKEAVENAGGIAELDSVSLRVIADHIRAAAYLVADKVIPSNEGRGYVLRRIIRRALRHGYQLGTKTPFFASLAKPLSELMGDAHPELADNLDKVTETLLLEEEQFSKTLSSGMKELNNVVDDLNEEQSILINFVNKYCNSDGEVEVPPSILKLSILENKLKNKFKKLQDKAREPFEKLEEAHKEVKEQIESTSKKYKLKANALMEIAKEAITIPGHKVFNLYDTYGFPTDLTANYARDNNLDIDLSGFKQELAKQQNRSRAASSFSVDIQTIAYEGPETNFERDTSKKIFGEVLAIYDTKGNVIEHLSEGDEGLVILSNTNFYAESGGQIGDRGLLIGENNEGVNVFNTIKVKGNVFGHQVTVLTGEIKVKTVLQSSIDTTLRISICRAHSATHLLHEALRRQLGEHVEQRGSLVEGDRLRFDYSHNHPLSDKDLVEVENLVCQQVLANAEVTIEELSYKEAIEFGAKALFGEKYGSVVRMVSIDKDYSIELCGGTHVNSASEVGLLHIKSDEAIAAGIRRIEATTGLQSQSTVREKASLVHNLETLLKKPTAEIYDEIQSLKKTNLNLQKQSENFELSILQEQINSIYKKEFGDKKYLVAKLKTSNIKKLKDAVTNLAKSNNLDLVVCIADNDKPALIIWANKKTGTFNAKELLNKYAASLGAKGGGNMELAQAGGGQHERIEETLKLIKADLN